ncbi:MAG: DUF2971 domain-containing protein [Negativicutes bacterium]|nr:DUF2971 domain-containing protein [Negativicutes bacterium]MDR3593100.1 DUF2971 domain-containing protein [Negativicutes bacterium]
MSENDVSQHNPEEREKIERSTFFFIKANNFFRAGNYFEALINVNDAIRIYEKNTPAHTLKIQILFVRKEFGEVILHLTTLESLYPDIYNVLNGDFAIGLAYHNIPNSLNAAERYYRKAIRNPLYQDIAYFYLGKVLIGLQNIEEGLEYFVKANELKPDWSTPLFQRAIIMWQNKHPRYNDAVLDFINKFPHNGLEVIYLFSLPVMNTPLGKKLTPLSELYHYTSEEGIKGIIETKKLRLTRIDFLNDPSERNYFAKVINSMITKAKNINMVQFETDLNVVKDLFEAIVSVVYESLRIQDSVKKYYKTSIVSRIDFLNLVKTSVNSGFDKYYVLSLTQEEDELPLWSMYCRNEGYNIEFNSTELVNNMVQLQTNVPELEPYLNMQSKIIYNHGTIYQLISYIYNKYFVNITDTYTRISLLLSVVIVASAFVKNKKFGFENESRIVVAKIPKPNNPDSHLEVLFRIANGTLIPFIEIPITDGTNWPIKRIKLGPNNKRDTAVPGMISFLAKHGLSHVKVVRSEIPLR